LLFKAVETIIAVLKATLCTGIANSRGAHPRAMLCPIIYALSPLLQFISATIGHSRVMLMMLDKFLVAKKSLSEHHKNWIS
jgi:hypothetical protein